MYSGHVLKIFFYLSYLLVVMDLPCCMGCALVLVSGGALAAARASPAVASLAEERALGPWAQKLQGLGSRAQAR